MLSKEGEIQVKWTFCVFVCVDELSNDYQILKGCILTSWLPHSLLSPGSVAVGLSRLMSRLRLATTVLPIDDICQMSSILRIWGLYLSRSEGQCAFLTHCCYLVELGVSSKSNISSPLSCFVCLFLSLSACLSVRLSDSLSACLPACLSVRLSVCLSACLQVYLSSGLSVCLFMCLSVCLSVCRFMNPPIWLSVFADSLRNNCLPFSVNRSGGHCRVPWEKVVCLCSPAIWILSGHVLNWHKYQSMCRLLTA